VNGVIEIAAQSNNADLESNWKKRRDLADSNITAHRNGCMTTLAWLYDFWRAT